MTAAPAACCCHDAPAAIQENREEKSSSLLTIIDRISRIALAAFALYLSPMTFVASCSIGFATGLSYGLYRHIKNQEPLPEGTGRPVCAQGYIDFLSGIRFSPLIGNLATAGFIAAHLRHDPGFYVPFSGFFIGLGTGNDLSHLAHRLVKKLNLA